LSDKEIIKQLLRDFEILKKENNALCLGIVKRKCIPFDFGPSRGFRNRFQRYHFLVLGGPEGRHNLSVLPMQIVKIELTGLNFNPSKYIKWKPKWFLKRNWGVYS
jgi:hypothetical protein